MSACCEAAFACCIAHFCRGARLGKILKLMMREMERVRTRSVSSRGVRPAEQLMRTMRSRRAKRTFIKTGAAPQLARNNTPISY